MSHARWQRGVGLSGDTTFFALNVVPLVLIGWLFSWKYVLTATVYIFLVQMVYMSNFYHLALDRRKTAMGLFTLFLFTLIGVMVDRFSVLSKKIKLLNSKLSEKNQELMELSLHDQLTHLYNRRYIMEIVFEDAKHFLDRLTLPEAQRRDLSLSNKVIAVFMVDIDHFKNINDTYGHGTGDLVLVEVAQRLRDAVRFDDIVARWGGEEFLLIFPSTNRDSLDLVVKKALNSVRAAPIVVNETTSIPVTVSIGCSCYPLSSTQPSAISFAQIISISDGALYLSKRNGRNQANLILACEDRMGRLSMRSVTSWPDLIEDGDFFIRKTFT